MPIDKYIQKAHAHKHALTCTDLPDWYWFWRLFFISDNTQARKPKSHEKEKIRKIKSDRTEN